MKTRLLGIVVAGLLGTALATTSIAQDRVRGVEGARGEGAGQMRGPLRGGRRPAAVIAAQPARFIKHHDANGDGTVSETEFVDARLGQVDAIFERRDDNGDGQIALGEHERPPIGRGGGRGPRGARADRPERAERPEIDREEVIACVRETIANYEPGLDRPVEEIFENIDTNADGMLSLQELGTALETRAHALFERIDVDGDGSITEAEVSAHFADQANVRRVVQACIKEQLEG